MTDTASPVTVEFTPEAVKKYLDDAITAWREKLIATSHQSALCYTDAFQSVRMSLFGEKLPPTPELTTWLETHDTEHVVISTYQYPHAAVLDGQFPAKS